jgi:Ca-activated chloride channel family protein
MTRLLGIALLSLSPFAFAADAPKPLNITLQPLGDAAAGVVARVTFRFTITSEVPPGVPLVIEGSASQGGKVVKRFRYPLEASQRESLSSVIMLQPGDAEIDARLMVPLEESAPVIVAKGTQTFTIAQSGTPYVADDAEGAEGVVAEGAAEQTAGAVRIVTPRRDVAPNLFVVEVDVKPPVRRVEFWIDERKIVTRNAPPYRAELDLGQLPKRVNVRAIGYDAQWRYVDADAFVVDEREAPLEVKITRTVAGDVTHFKLSVQNPKSTAIKSVVFFAGQKKLQEWTQPPYALTIANAKLEGVDFVRASVVDETGYEASDLVFLNGQRFSEEIDVNVVELPVSVTDASGASVTDLKQDDVSVAENGKPQKINAFNYASNLPISAGILIDHSGSMKPRIEAARAAAIEFFKKIMKGGDKAFVGGFAFDVTKSAPFVASVPALQDQVASMPEANGGTSLYDAIVTGLYRFRSVSGRRALIILTDGEDTTSRVSYDDMLLYARAARVPLYFIGIGMSFFDAAGSNKMKFLAAESGGVAYFIKDVKQLGETYEKLERELRSQYLLAYNSESSRGDRKYRTVDVKVKRPGVTVRTIRGFIP